MPPETTGRFKLPVTVKRAPDSQSPACPGQGGTDSGIFSQLKVINDTLQQILFSTKPLPDAYSSDELAVSASTPVKPSNPNAIAQGGSPGYDKLPIYEILLRKSPRLTVLNDGTATIYVLATTEGQIWSGPEQQILIGEAWTFYNVYGLRVRSPIIGNVTAMTGGVYRVTEYDFLIPYAKLIVPGAFTPINKASVVGQAQPGAGADILLALTGASLTATNTPTTFRVMVAMSSAGTFSASINDGVNPVQVVNFNVVPGPALVANGLYIFDMMVQANWTVDFRYSVTGGTILILSVQEIDAAAA